MINLERECDLLGWCHPGEVCAHGSDILPGGWRVTCSYLDGVILARSVPMVLMTLLPNMMSPMDMPNPP